MRGQLWRAARARPAAANDVASARSDSTEAQRLGKSGCVAGRYSEDPIHDRRVVDLARRRGGDCRQAVRKCREKCSGLVGDSRVEGEDGDVGSLQQAGDIVPGEEPGERHLVPNAKVEG